MLKDRTFWKSYWSRVGSGEELVDVWYAATPPPQPPIPFPPSFLFLPASSPISPLKASCVKGGEGDEAWVLKTIVIGIHTNVKIKRDVTTYMCLYCLSYIYKKNKNVKLTYELSTKFDSLRAFPVLQNNVFAKDGSQYEIACGWASGKTRVRSLLFSALFGCSSPSWSSKCIQLFYAKKSFLSTMNFLLTWNYEEVKIKGAKHK